MSAAAAFERGSHLRRVPLGPGNTAAERILIAGECIGKGRWFLDRATVRARGERSVFGRPIGANQGIQFPWPGLTSTWRRLT